MPKQKEKAKHVLTSLDNWVNFLKIKVLFFLFFVVAIFYKH